METLVNSIAIISARFLGRDDIADFMEAVENNSSLEPSADAVLLATSVGITCQELAEEHFPLETNETITSDENCKLNFSDFSFKPRKILAVKDATDNTTTFRTFDGFIKVCAPNADFEVYYEKIPEIADIGENVEHSAKVSERIIAYGACMHFCLCSLLYDEAKLWDARYHDAIDELRIHECGKKKLKRKWSI